MTLDEPNRMDIVTRSANGEIGLHIVATGDWSSDSGMLDQLRAKLQAYVSFCGSQAYADQFGASPKRIHLSATHEVTKQALELVGQTSSESGIPIDVVVEPATAPLYGENLPPGSVRRSQVRRPRSGS